jgi:drug/metabolite transporter (DMT)-like permease
MIVALISGAVGVWEMQQAERETARWSKAAWGHLGLGTLCYVLVPINMLGVLFSIPSLAIMVYYMSPLWTIVFSAMFLRDTLRWITGATILVVVACVGIPTILIQADHDTDATKCIALLFSLAGGVGYAGFLTVCRSANTECPDLPMNLAAGVGNAVVSIAGFASALIEGAVIVPAKPNFWILISVNGACIGVAAAILPYASKHLQSVEVSALLMLDLIAVQPPLYAFHLETARVEKMIGSVVLLLALIVHECVSGYSRQSYCTYLPQRSI